MEKNISEEEKKILRKELDEVYTPISKAREEVWKRWNDKKLRKKVEDFLGGDVPEFSKDSPKAYFARNIISPNFELLNFLKVVANLDMEFGFIEHAKDKFTSRNSSKYHVCRLFFHDGKSNNSGDKVSGLKIVNMERLDGNSMDSIQTNWGEKLVDFHHCLLDITIPNIHEKIYDISSWNKCDGGAAKNFYEHYLAIFICGGILFENFLLNKEEMEFTKNTVIPAFKKIEEFFGVKPLIVRMLPKNKEEENFWFYYPCFLKPVIKNIIKINNKID